MTALRYTLLADGTSDRCLIWIINWCLVAIPTLAARGFIPQMADLRQLPSPPRNLTDRMHRAIQQYPCDILLVHRDAEDESHEVRFAEIHAAATNLPAPHVPIIPVRMTEAWLLLEEPAIREAADNPNGRVHLNLPDLATLERIPDPKELLSRLLIAAAEKTGRRKDQFQRDLPLRRQRVAELIRDFSPLQRLPAFTAFQRDLRSAALAWVDGAS